MGPTFSQQLLNAQMLFVTAFNEGVEAIKAKAATNLIWPQKAMKVNIAGSESSIMGFLAEQPKFRKWVGERETKTLKVGSYTLGTDKYEFEYSIPRDTIKFDKFGLLATHPRGAGRASAMFYEDLVNTAQQNGTTALCVDGQPYYDVDHPSGLDGSGATFSNYRTGTALTADNVASGITIMAGLVDANGDNFGVMPNILEYGPGQWKTVRDILNAEITANAFSTAIGSELHSTSNTLAGVLTPVLNKKLPAGQWYLHDTESSGLPFILLEEEAPTGLEMRVDPLDPHVWSFDEFLFGARARAGAGYFIPHVSQRNEA